LGESGGALSAVWLVGKVRCYARSEPLSSSRFSRVGTDAGDLRNRGATGHAPGPLSSSRFSRVGTDAGDLRNRGATHVRSHFPQAASRVWALTQETCETAVLLATHLGRRLQPVAHATIKTLVPIFDNRRSKVRPRVPAGVQVERETASVKNAISGPNRRAEESKR
jgi:hypothetical protein